MTAAVYGCFLIGAPSAGAASATADKLASSACVCTLLPSVIFFVVTNLVQWPRSMPSMRHRMYAAGWSGLAACYAAGVPFFRWMAEGDVVFAAMLFG